MEYIVEHIIPLFESYCKQNDVDEKVIPCNIGEHDFKVKIASTPDSQAKGYMDQESPSDGEGILFVYRFPKNLRFWMKNVSFPLDILFFDANGNLVEYKTMHPDTSDAPQIHTSSKPCRYALETKAGWCKQNLDPEKQYSLNI